MNPHWLIDLNAIAYGFVAWFPTFEACVEAARVLYILSDGLANGVCMEVPGLPV